MKSSLGWIVIASLVAATALMLAMSARAGERGGDPPAAPEESTGAEGLDATIIFSAEGVIGGEDETTPPPASVQDIHDSLVAISPGGGTQLPPAAALDRGDWQLAQAGAATMRVPADWTAQNRIGAPGEDDQTVGLAPPSNDLYIELRVIRNADSNYLQALGEHARSEYSRSPGRLAEGVILGYQPRLQGGAAGHVEVMNQFGKEFDDDGARTFRLVLWRGRWEEDGDFHRVEFTATMAQADYDRLAPLVAAILDTVAVGASEGAAVE